MYALLNRSGADGFDLNLRNGSGTYYDHLGRPTRWAHFDTEQTTRPALVGYDYIYDGAGNKLMSAALHDGRETQQYKYDSASRLVTYVRGDNPFDDRCVPIGDCAPGAEKARRWWLDGVGNWKQTEQRDQFNADSFDTRGVTSFNEYTVAAAATLDYDDNGNLMNDEKNLHYHWDAFNRLHRVTDASDATTATYTYDTDGRRLMKDLSGTTSDVSFAYDGWQIILEYAGAAGLPLRQYTYGAFINEPLFMDVADGNGEFLDEGDSSPLERYSYLQTPIYNVAALVDYDTQELVERYDYDPYGKYTLVVGDTRTELGQSLVGNSMTFTGHWFDRETGMYWMRMRIYNYKIGVFISRDPIMPQENPNLYEYCRGSVTALLDPFGLREMTSEEKGFVEKLNALSKKAKGDKEFEKALDAVIADYKKLIDSIPSGSTIRLDILNENFRIWQDPENAKSYLPNEGNMSWKGKYKCNKYVSDVLKKANVAFEVPTRWFRTRPPAVRETADENNKDLSKFTVVWKIVPIEDNSKGGDGGENHESVIIKFSTPLDGKENARVPIAGDIVSFGNDHVGIYLGHGLYISATTIEFLGQSGVVIKGEAESKVRLYRSPDGK